MKYILIFSIFLTGLGGCEDKKAKEGCEGPDRFVFKDARAAFLESGFVLLETKQDPTFEGSKVPYINCQPCSKIDTSNLKIQRDNGSVTMNYLITCGIKYAESNVTYAYPPAPRIVIYSIKPI